MKKKIKANSKISSLDWYEPFLINFGEAFMNNGILSSVIGLEKD
jgi:hypothetical protein